VAARRTPSTPSTRTTTKKTPAKARSARGKATPVKATKASKTSQASKAAAVPLNHIAIVVDRSGSMSGIAKDVVKVFNSQLQEIKQRAKTDNQETYVSFWTFNNTVDKPLHFQRQAQAVSPLKSLKTTGGTALFDAVGTAITSLSKARDAKKAHASFLLIALTDGEENASRQFRTSLPKMIKEVQKTGRWSLAFLTPKSGVKVLKRFGIPQGNIQDWSATSKGTAEMGERLRAGLRGFFDARGGGKSSVAGFFKTDLTKVSVKDVADNLVDVSDQFKVWSVDNDAAIIAPFVNKMLNGKATYEKGKGYYELTKSELVQAKKEIAIRDDKSGAIYCGMAARSMLGLPDGQAFKVKPGEHGNFSVFVMSTSLNRVLSKGTSLLYRDS
jgi:Mg-chelatase subunit ChlD